MSLPPQPPFRVETNVEATEWLDSRLQPRGEGPPLVGFIVPSGFEAYARLLHPSRRFLGRSGEQRVPLRWSDPCCSRQDDHPEVQIQALVDSDHEYWKARFVGRCLGISEAC